ncbi:pelota mRNA surveillance and ribosome rescue factor [Oratosquilla oratoria]|uniref:pelota mRNA surveillance and ribosome rescue factor n=1 Tax=Oratosquilla oratoria TaxID=337810 RepID=UPI003F76EBEF
MKLSHRDIEKDGRGHMVLTPDEGEDMWHCYNLITEGDMLRASTIRKVQQESATGSSTSSRVRTTITIRVENIDFDTAACVLRVKGRNCVENQYIKMGAYHTVDLEPNRKFTLHKEHWDTIYLERVETACDPAKHADLAAVVMQEGLAFVCLITSAMTIDRAKIDVNIPKKGKGDGTQRNKAVNKFFDQVMAAIVRHLDFSIVKAVLIASPGFVKDQFFDYMMKTAVQADNKLILENKSKFVLVHSSNGFKHSLREVLEDQTVTARLADTKAAGEMKVLQQFMSLMGTDPDRAYYGIRHVEKANESQAIETLLVSDSLFRSWVLAERKRYVRLVDAVRDNGGDVKIFSSLHVSGEQLDQMTGVAAILRFPMPEIEEEDHNLDSDEE